MELVWSQVLISFPTYIMALEMAERVNVYVFKALKEMYNVTRWDDMMDYKIYKSKNIEIYNI